MAQCKCGAINEYQEEPYTCRDCRNEHTYITTPAMATTTGTAPDENPFKDPGLRSAFESRQRLMALDREIVLAAVAFVHERGQLAVQQRVKELCRLVVERDNMVTRPEDIEAAEALKQEYKKVQKDLWERLGKLPPAIRAKIEADL